MEIVSLNDKVADSDIESAGSVSGLWVITDFALDSGGEYSGIHQGFHDNSTLKCESLPDTARRGDSYVKRNHEEHRSWIAFSGFYRSISDGLQPVRRQLKGNHRYKNNFVKHWPTF